MILYLKSMHCLYAFALTLQFSANVLSGFYLSAVIYVRAVTLSMETSQVLRRRIESPEEH